MIAAVVAAFALATGPAPVQVVLPGRMPVTAAVTAPAAGDTNVRIPGTVLRLGWDRGRISTLGSFRLSDSKPGHETREGEVRWFGYSATAALSFRDDRLDGVRLTSPEASPRFIDFVPDELRRLGYRCVERESKPREGTSRWQGPLDIRLTRARGTITIEVAPRHVPAPAVAPPAAAAPFDFTAPGAESLAAPAPASTPGTPQRPQIAVDAGVFGRVQVRVTVDADGRVTHAEIDRGIPELNNAALEWASAVRFEPWIRGGTPAPFVTRIPVAFLPVRDTTKEGTP